MAREVKTVIVDLYYTTDTDYLESSTPDEYYGYGRELVYCNDCKYKTRCFSDVVMIDKSRTTNIYGSVQWCSLGERETDND